jgi:hypothetical protein
VAPIRRRLSRGAIGVIAAAVLGHAEPGLGGPPVPLGGAGGPRPIDAGQFLERVQRAIDSGVAWLRRQQGQDGSWGSVTPDRSYDPSAKGALRDYPTGTPSLCAYTLMKCGAASDDVIVKKALDFLRARKSFPSSYELSMAILAATATADPAKKTADSIASGEKVKLKGEWYAFAKDLVAQLVKRRAPAGWRYNWAQAPPEKGGDQDLSSTQLAALALLAADRAGISVEGRVWNDLVAFAFAQQDPDGPAHARGLYARHRVEGVPVPAPAAGAPTYATPAETKELPDKARGFAYIRSPALSPDEGKPTGGMTACGMGIVATARWVLEQRGEPVWKRRDPAVVDQALRDAAAWLDLHWSPFENPGKTDFNVYHVYYLYCVERAMDLVGATRIGRHDWFVEMGTKLLAKQSPDGSWNSETAHRPKAVLDTCFALLFLSRATKGGIPLPAQTEDLPPAQPSGDRK